jgi:hypothetical protein
VALQARAAAGWLCLAAVATALNSLILFKYSRFVDFAVGLSFTQLIDAVSVGMALEPKGSPWWWTALPAFVFDLPLICLLLILAVKVLHQRHRATQVSFWLYAIDTFVFLLMFTANVVLHAPTRALVVSGLPLIAHTVGLFILFRAWRKVLYTSAPA